MDERDVRPWLSSGLLWMVFYGVSVLATFPPSDVQTSLESCGGIAWCGIDGVAYPRIPLAVVDSLFMYSTCIMAIASACCWHCERLQ